MCDSYILNQMVKKHLFFRCPVEDGSNQRKFWSLCFSLWGKNLLLNTSVIAVYAFEM
jgi:hypothetical protein